MPPRLIPRNPASQVTLRCRWCFLFHHVKALSQLFASGLLRMVRLPALEPIVTFGVTTCRLQGGCSTSELYWHNKRILSLHAPPCAAAFYVSAHPRIQPHPYHGPPTTAVFLIPPAQLPSVCVSLAFQPLRLSGRLCKPPSYTPLTASGQNPRYGTHHGEVCRGCLVLCALDFGLGRSALFERECRFWRPGFYLKLRPYMKPHAGLAPAPLRDSGAHPPADNGGGCAT